MTDDTHAALARHRTARLNSRRTTIAASQRAVVFEIGWLRDDVDVLAANVARASACEAIAVWIDDELRVQASSATTVPTIPVHWIVGTYACGASTADIADDLRFERNERQRAWQID